MGWWSAPLPGRINYGKTDGTHCGGFWVGPILGLEDAENLVPTEIRSTEWPNLKTL